jgi:hypothetical protein
MQLTSFVSFVRQAVAKFQTLFPRQLLLALVTSKRIPSRFKRNVCELLHLLWVAPLEMESHHLPHQSLIRMFFLHSIPFFGISC